mmetsp:Transcript_9356/g.16571  ORF Transcript_9356/g.16571 Transcript_9356/m.16571 type:complete len:84 (+) Transcript_9356:439-690(+)
MAAGLAALATVPAVMTTAATAADLVVAAYQEVVMVVWENRLLQKARKGAKVVKVSTKAAKVAANLALAAKVMAKLIVALESQP